jgi:hypothetical protein
MATTTINYSANTAITLDLSSLGTSSNFVAGVESGQIDNTTDKYIDAIVNVKGITGHASTAPTIGQQIVVYVWGADTSLATTSIDANTWRESSTPPVTAVSSTPASVTE